MRQEAVAWLAEAGEGHAVFKGSHKFELSAELPFRRAAEILSCFVPSLSHMTVWRIVQEAGEAAEREWEEKRAEVFEEGKDAY